MALGATSRPITEALPWRRPPRDAATLIVVDDSAAEVRILLGRRGDRHIFMPGKFVFPGGRVDPADMKLARHLVSPSSLIDRLLVETPARFGETNAAAVALAGIRETFEEAGMMVGRPFPEAVAKYGGSWSAFSAAGLAPDLSALVPIARAITPPGQVRRYDTRFFCTSIEAVAHKVPFENRIDLELDSLGWFTVAEALELDLPGITRQVLGDIAGRLQDGSWRHAGSQMPFYRVRHRRLVRDMI